MVDRARREVVVGCCVDDVETVEVERGVGKEALDASIAIVSNVYQDARIHYWKNLRV